MANPNQLEFIPSSREEDRELLHETRPVYEILGDIKRLQAEESALLAKLEELIA